MVKFVYHLLIYFFKELLEDKGDGYDEHNASLYQDSGFGGTVSTEKSASIKSSKSRMSKQSKMSTSEKSHSSVVTGTSAAATEDIGYENFYFQNIGDMLFNI